jgi:hypothetical protein
VRTNLVFAAGLVAVAAVFILPTTAAMASTAINIVNDNRVVGTDYILQSFDSSSLVLTGRNDKGTFTATLEFGKTVFRSAQQLDKWQPSDPYREACLNASSSYNNVINSDSLTAGLASFANGHCAAKVLVDTKSGTVKSFRPVFQPSDPY